MYILVYWVLLFVLKKCCGFAFAIIAVTILVMPMITVGYALAGYSAVTVNGGNTLTAEYMNANLYTKNAFSPDNDYVVSFDEDDFTPISSNVFNTGQINYTDNGSKVIQEGIYTLTPDNLFLVVRHSSGTVAQYSLDFNYAVKDDGADLEGVTCNIYLGSSDSPVTDSDSFNTGTAYRLKFDALFGDTPITTTNITGLLWISAIRLNLGYMSIFAESHSCNMHLVQSSPILDNIDFAPGDGGHDPIVSNVGSYPSIIVKSDTNTSEHNGVADANGIVNVQATVPSDINFCLRFRSYDGTAYIHILVKESNGATIYDSHNDRYYGTSGYKITNANTYIGINGAKGSLNNAGWFVSASGAISITVSNGPSSPTVPQGLVMELIFRDNPA